MKKYILFPMALALPLLPLACGDDDGQTGDSTTVATTAPIPTTIGPITTMPLPADAEPVGVLLGALILIAGDAEAAVASGVVAPDEIDAAATALETGTLQQWVTAASQLFGG